ncbi:MAG: ABC transporter ATP-binding protein, partial [Geminicoccaceae bacterium]
MTVLEVRGLTKSFGGVVAVDGVDFDLKERELLALIGPNGAGKTTCFNMLNGQLRPDHGSVTLLGKQLVGLRPRQIWRLGVGRTFQITQTFASMTVRENVQMALISHHRELFRVRRPAAGRYVRKADALLRQVGMVDQAERAASVLAYGDLKRLELAVALANRPKLLLMD